MNLQVGRSARALSVPWTEREERVPQRLRGLGLKGVRVFSFWGSGFGHVFEVMMV